MAYLWQQIKRQHAYDHGPAIFGKLKPSKSDVCYMGRKSKDLLVTNKWLHVAKPRQLTEPLMKWVRTSSSLSSP